MPVGMLTTQTPGGTSHSRPMFVHDIDETGWLWFLTDRHSRKACELSRNPSATIAFQSRKGDRYVSVQGTAVVVNDDVKLRELWNPSLRSWFPRGRPDPEIVLVAVRVSRAEYWLVPRTRLSRLMGAASAMMTGKRRAAGKYGILGVALTIRMRREMRLPAETCRRRWSYVTAECPPAFTYLATACLISAVDTGAQTNTWRQCLADTSPAAIEACTSIILLDPHNDGALVNRGIAYRRLGDINRAITDYDEAIRLNPRAADAFNNRGNAFRALDDLDRAMRDYDEAIRLDAHYAHAFNNRGVIFLESGRCRASSRRLQQRHRTGRVVRQRISQPGTGADEAAALRSCD